MATNVVKVRALRQHVYEVLVDPSNFARWVLGAREIRGVDPNWPRPGSTFHHTSGVGPIRIHDKTILLATVPGESLSLDAHLGPLGRVRIDLTLSDTLGGTEVKMVERPGSGPAGAAWPVAEVLLKARNAGSLGLLRELVEGGTPAPDLATLAEIVQRAGSGFVAAGTARDIHVTPHLCTAMGDRVWFVTAAASTKTQLASKRPTLGMLFVDGERTAVLQGEAVVLDALNLPLQPETLLAGMAGPAYARRHAGELLQWVKELPTLARHPIAGRRVLVALRPRYTLILENGRLSEGVATAERLGEGARTEVVVRPAGIDLAPDLEGLVERDQPVVVGWKGRFGPLALPATWDASERTATVPSDVARAAQALEGGPSCVAFLGGDDRGPRSKSGLMLRGNHLAGAASSTEDSETETMQPERASYWQGHDTGTVDASRA